MKTNRLQFTLLFCFLMLLGACKKIENRASEASKPSENSESVSHVNPEEIRLEDLLNPNIRNIKPGESSIYKSNLEIVTGRSFYDNKFENSSGVKEGIIYLEIPIANDKFKFYKKYDVSSNNRSAILYIITDYTTSSTMTDKKTHVLEDSFKMKDFIKGDQVKGKKLFVYTFSDLPSDLVNYEQDIVNYFKALANSNTPPKCEILSLEDIFPDQIAEFTPDKRPKESCGGVIVGN